MEQLECSIGCPTPTAPLDGNRQFQHARCFGAWRLSLGHPPSAEPKLFLSLDTFSRILPCWIPNPICHRTHHLPNLTTSSLQFARPLRASQKRKHLSPVTWAGLTACNAGGVAGNNKHLKVLLDYEEATLLVTEAAEHLSVADVSAKIAEALGLGVFTALLKENGRIRGIVTGDTFRRGVARALAQQCAKKFEEACMPFQYALSTQASMIELDPTKTLGPSTTSSGSPCWRPSTTILIWPFSFLSSGCSTGRILLTCGTTTREHRMTFCRVRGEQGDPLMPALYALGQHTALTEVQATLRDGKMLFAYLDDICVLLASKSILGRPRFGTTQPSSRRTWTPLALRRGQVRAQRRIEGSWCWECPSATGHSCRSGWQTKGSHIRSFSVEFQLSKMHRARGYSS